MSDGLRPVGDMVLLSVPKKDQTDAGLHLVGSVAQEKFARVLAFGEGVGEVPFAVGDRVLLKGDLAQFVEMDDHGYVLCPPSGIVAVVEDGVDVN